MSTHSRDSRRRPVGHILIPVVAAALLFGAVGAVAFTHYEPWAAPRLRSVAVTKADDGASLPAQARAASAIVSRAQLVTPPQIASATPSPTVAPSRPATPTPKPAVPKPAAVAVDRVAAYRGLGSWVDIWEDRAWADPAATVRDMKAHGVRTLYLETGNSKASQALKDPAKTATFIRTAHGNGMKVVAWYLPEMTNVDYDFGRIAQALRFRTSDGQRFDSFALDIESPVVADQTQRNANLAALSKKIRGLAGKDYPLGAIIPSPSGLARNGSYWSRFPYTGLAQTYDIFVPMSYYTYHGNGGPAARDDTLANMRVLRSQPGCGSIPVHLIGGLTQDSTDSEVRAFVQAAEQTGAAGASLYSWTGMTAAQWAQLAAVK